MASSSGTATEAQRETILPLSLVRTHCKVEDVPYVTDAMLVLYREAAFDMASLYSSVNFNPNDYTTQAVPMPKYGIATVRLDEPAIDGIVTVTVGATSVQVVIPPGGKHVNVGPQMPGPDGTAICNSLCSPSPTYFGTAGYQEITLRYRSGACGAGTVIKAGIRIAMLQFIDWMINHPGSCEGTQACIASGAMKTFRMYNTEIGF